MPRGNEPPVAFSRLLELAQDAFAQRRCRFTPFLTPPEAALVKAAAGRAGVAFALSGGYEGAERCVARFCPEDAEPEPFPVSALEIRWRLQQAPEHRDLLGAVMGLGVQRNRVGDIVPDGERAFLFADASLAEMILQNLREAGRAKLAVTLADGVPVTAAAEGEPRRGTVQSPRLDALVAEGFGLSRGAAAELIESGAVKLRHAPVLRPDARVEAGDAISVRGYGRLRIDEYGGETRKGRIPVRYARFGASR
jgi:RNA-binding protein YlmH